MQAALDAGADVVVQINQENRHAFKVVQKIGATQPLPRFTYTETQKEHGRLTTRSYRAYPITPYEAGLPQVQTLITVERTTEEKEETQHETSYYLSTHSREKGVRYFANLIRGHLAGCEIRNHWFRDHILQEDRTRIKNYKINCNLTTLRICALALKANFFTDQSWPETIETCQLSPKFAYNMVSNHRSK